MAQNADVKQELVAIADELDRRGLKGMADEVTQILAAVVQEERVASLPDPEYLVQVADRLDQEGRYDEADRVTAYAQQVSMVRSAQAMTGNALQKRIQQLQQQQGVEQGTYGPTAGGAINRGGRYMGQLGQSFGEMGDAMRQYYVDPAAQAAQRAGQWAQQQGQAAGQAAREVGRGLGQMGQEAVQGAKQIGQGIGQAVGQAGRAVAAPWTNAQQGQDYIKVQNMRAQQQQLMQQMQSMPEGPQKEALKRQIVQLRQQAAGIRSQQGWQEGIGSAPWGG